MADINEILGRQINSVKELKSAIKELQDSLIGVDADSEQFKTTTDQLAAAQAELNKVTKAGKDDNNAAADSIRGMEQEYKKLYDTYKQLSEEQRNSDIGKNMAESLETLSSKINETKKDVGNFKDNIGRYAQSASEAFNGMGVSIGGLQTPLKLATGGAKTFGTALKTLAANPIVLVITALVAILVKAAEAIKKNEELTNRLQQAFSVFRPVLDAVANAFDFLAGLLVKTVEGLSKVAEKILSIIPGMKQAIQSHKELEKATQNLTKATREANIENSKKQAEIERLREEASATEDVVEKKKLLEEAKAIQAEVDAKNVELAQEELRIMQEYAEKTANSAAENEKLAAAQKKVNDAIAQGERNMRMYNKQLDAATNKTKSTTSSGGKSVWQKEEEELEKFNVEYEKSIKTQEKQINEHYDKLVILARKHNKDITNIEAARATELAKLSKLNQQEELEREKRHRDNLAKLRNDPTTDAFADLSELQVHLTGITNSFKVLIDTFKENDFNELAEVFETLKNSGDWTKLDDFSYILGLFPQFESNLKNIAAIWPQLVAPVQGLINRVKELFGVTIQNAQDLEDELNLIPQKANEALDNIAENYGEKAVKRISESLRDANIDLFKELFSYDTGMTSFSEIQNLRLEGEYTVLEKEKALYEQELAEFKGTQDQKLELLENYYAVLEEIYNRQHAVEELHAERTREIWDAAFDHFDAWTNSLDSVLGAIGNVMQAEIDSGKLTEKEAKKKERTLKALEKVQLAVAVANIAANTAAGIMDVWRGYAAELPVNAQTAAATGPAAAATKAALDAKSLATAIIRTTTIGAQGTAQLAAAIGGYISKSMASASAGGEGGGSVGVATTPTLIDSTPYSYTRTVQSQEEYDALNRPIWVSVEDISNGLGHQVSVRDESSF